MTNCTEKKRKLIERIGIHFEKEMDLSPLAARILGLLILSPSEDLSFEDITNITCASKSSISTNINLLLQLKIIDYFTKPGDRRRYFRASRNHLKLALNDNLSKVEKELEVLELIDEFNQGDEKESNHKFQVRLLYREFLKNQQKNLQNTLKKISEIQDTQ
ncbi:GbsR/MarR family transcriptional regulator [Haloflavibacter putidus]|uniref:Transcriptional regulator n=1 Tax=Haloflavibacter putidus TaxID=2576776 RepID=A0A507ZVS2_9FLAO|nr:transcriptional regulator [Haloflavibacter putidus]TQD40563.1 transcriptional regulator [Haloflavibacter putidus]